MSSTFAGLPNVSAALNAQRYGLDVTGQDIANAGTAGYTRQRAELVGVGPVVGVQVSGTSRLNDPVIDGRARAEHGRNSYLQTGAAWLSGVEALFNEPSDSGLGEQLNDFWNSWAGVANNPGDAAARSVVLQKAAGLATTLYSSSASLSRLTQGVVGQLADVTAQVNSAAAAVTELNGAVKVATASGINTNALADQRDALLMNLADLAGAQATHQADGSVTVKLGGQELVAGTMANTLAGGAATELTVGDAPVTTVDCGVLQSLVDSLNTTLPGYAAKLDAVAAALAESVNGVQQSGYDLAGTPGGPLFTGSTAANLTVAGTDPTKLAASGTPGGNRDGSLAAKLAALGGSATGADSQYRQLVSTLGADAQNVTRQAAVQQSVTSGVDDLAKSVAGVSLNEETSALPTYQRAFQASSRVLNTVDEMAGHTDQPYRKGRAMTMRISERTAAHSTLAGLQANASPLATALQLRSELKRMDQYQSSASDAVSWLSTVDNALSSTTNRMQQVRSLVLQGLNTGSGDANSNEALAKQVDQARAALLSVSNTSYLGRPVFGGTTAGSTAFDSTGKYVGDTGTVSRTVQPNTTVEINRSGTATFGQDGSNLFDLLTDIAEKLRSDPSSLSGDLDRIDTAQRSLSGQQALAGAKSQRIQSTQSVAVTNTIVLKSHLSDLQDIDLAATAIEMATADAAYQASLATTTKIRQISLLDFLR